MKKEYWFVIIAYIVMQFSGLIGAPLFSLIAMEMGAAQEKAEILAMAYWSIFSFVVTLLIILLILRKDLTSSTPDLRNKPKASLGISALWGVLGIFLAFFSQSLAITIENALGIQAGSENTQFIVKIISTVPAFAIISSIVGPILEELVFRKIIFGTFYKKYNFFIAGLISSAIFGLAHFEFEHLILYTAMGFTFAFLYVKTNRIIVPIFAHVAMNTMVVIVQTLFKEDIEKQLQNMEQMQSFIGGLL